MDFMEKTSVSVAIIYDFIHGNKSVIASEYGLIFAHNIIENILKKVRYIEFRLQFFFDLIFSTLNNFIQPCVNIFIIAILGKNVVLSNMSLGTFVLIITFYNIFQLGLNTFQNIADILFHTNGAIDNINDFLHSKALQELQNIKQTPIEYFYKMDSVSLTLNEIVILRNTSLTLKYGGHYALVGLSGLGKSTLVKLLISFQKSDTGVIHFMNDFNDVSKISVLKNIAWFSQDTDIFNLSLKDNIFLGDEYNEQEYIELKELLHFAPLECRNLGSSGCNISGGQKQLVGLARFLHQIKKKDYYFIDEGFISLDEYTKQYFLEITQNAIKGKTGICITHDNSVFQALCNSVLVYNKCTTISLHNKIPNMELKQYYRE